MTIVTEQTTAATDALMAVVALACGFVMWDDGFRARLWCAMFVASGVASALGAIVHGVVLDDAIHAQLWTLTYLSLSLSVALFATGAATDRLGETIGRRCLVIMLLVGMAFFSYIAAEPSSFSPFIVFEAVVLLLSLAGYLSTFSQPGAWIVGMAIVLTLFAGLVQATGLIQFTLIWPFDHNGVFHLLQSVALVLLLWGLKLMRRQADV